MIRIDKEFHSLLEPLTDDEYNHLEQNIIADGCREPLVIWNDVLIDGHNRYKICTEYKIIYATVEKEFADRDEAKDWIDSNQMGRRNLNPAQLSYLRGRRYDRSKLPHGAPVGNKNASKQTCENCIVENTAKKLAEEHGVGERTIYDDHYFFKAVETIKDDFPEVAAKVHNKEKIVKNDIIKAANAILATTCLII